MSIIKQIKQPLQPPNSKDYARPEHCYFPSHFNANEEVREALSQDREYKRLLGESMYQSLCNSGKDNAGFKVGALFDMISNFKGLEIWLC